MKRILAVTAACAALMLTIPMLTGCATTGSIAAKKGCKTEVKKNAEPEEKKGCCGGCKGKKN